MISFGAVLALLAATSSAYNGPLMCLRYCGNAEFEPICGSNGQETKLFNSKCELRNAECGDRVSWFIKPMPECLALAGRPVDNFPIPKPHDVDELLVNPFSIKKISKKSKKQQPVDARNGICDLICPQYYLPICGFDGEDYKIFANLCFLQLTNCKSQQKFTLATVDRCDFSVRVKV